MADQHSDFQQAGVQVLAVARHSVPDAEAYARDHNLPFPVLSDAAHTVYAQYGVESKALSLGQRPGLFVIDRQGVVRFAQVGWQQWEIPKNQQVLDVCRSVPCTAPS